jgi:hypothetical protein
MEGLEHSQRIIMKKIFFTLGIFAMSLKLFAGAGPGIQHVRVIWHEDPAHSAYVMWTTDKYKIKSYLYYDTVPRKGVISKYRYKNNAKTKPILYTLDTRHKSKLKKLKPNTTYYFTAVTNGAKSKEYHFKTAPSDGTPFKILFGGDSRSDRPKRREINRVLSKTFESDISIIALCHGGDYIDNGLSWKKWKAWLEDHLLTTTSKGRILPIIPTRGNHELGSPLFNDVFARPGGLFKKNYYRTKIGDFSIITLNSNASAAGRQKRWLKKTLKKARKDSKWIVANYHRPLWPAVKKPGRGIKHWVPLFEDYQIDLAFESDGHVLKRTVPIYRNTQNSTKGIIYVGEGGLGVKQRNPKKDRWFLRSPGYATSKHHFMTLEVTPSRMIYTVDLPDGTVFDKMELLPRKR